jgi:hypothetical protein
MHRVAQLRRGRHVPLLHDPGEALVLGDLPADLDHAVRHPATAVHGERVGGKTRPEHHAVRMRVAGGDAEPERVGGKARRSPSRARTRARGPEGERRRAEELPPAESAHDPFLLRSTGDRCQ